MGAEHMATDDDDRPCMLVDQVFDGRHAPAAAAAGAALDGDFPRCDRAALDRLHDAALGDASAVTDERHGDS
jgi:hypothetical protein